MPAKIITTPSKAIIIFQGLSFITVKLKIVKSNPKVVNIEP